MDPFIHNLSCVMICKGNLFYWYSEVTILHVWAFLTFGLSLLGTFNYYFKKNNNNNNNKKTIHYPTLPAKTLCSIPSTHLQGFRNYIATILKSYLRGMSIISLGLLCAVHRSVLYVMLRAVSSICSVVFLYSLLATFCCQCFSLWGFVPPLE